MDGVGPLVFKKEPFFFLGVDPLFMMLTLDEDDFTWSFGVWGIHAYLLNGIWREQPERRTWQGEFDAMLNSLFEDALITVVDCHG